MNKGEMEFDNLTSLSQTPYSSNEGGNFMPEESEQNEAPKNSNSQETPKSTSGNQEHSSAKEEQSPPTDRNEKKTNDAETARKPLSRQTTESLKNEYLQSIITEQKATAGIMDFAGKEEAAAEAQAYNQALIKELESRGVDVKELFLDATKASAEAGHPVRSIGAATASGTGVVIDGSGTTDEYLLKQVEGANKLIEARDGEDAENIVLDYYKKVIEYSPGRDPSKQKERDDLIQEMQDKLKKIRDQNWKKAQKFWRPGLYHERQLTPEEIKLVKTADVDTPGKHDKDAKIADRENLFNRLFRRVDVSPRLDFESGFGTAGEFEYTEFLQTLTDGITEAEDAHNTALKDSLEKTRDKFVAEKTARTMIHNAYFAVLNGLDTNKVSEYVSGFKSDFADLAFSKIGVTQAMHFYEQALLITKESAGGYLKGTDVGGGDIDEKGEISKGKVNILAEKLLNDANEKGVIKDRDGNIVKLKDWEINRALSFARGMSIATGRTIEIAATSLLADASLADLFGQRIIAQLYPFRHDYKFYSGKNKKTLSVLAYLRHGRKWGIFKKRPWSYKEIQDFADLTDQKQIDVLNGLAPGGKEYYLGLLNPFEIGGILSRTGWRISDKWEGSMVGKWVRDFGKGNLDQARIGTGMQLERNRGALGDAKHPDHDKAVEAVWTQLENVGNRTPLRIFLNVKIVQGKVLTMIAGEAGNATALRALREKWIEQAKSWGTEGEIKNRVKEIEKKTETDILKDMWVKPEAEWKTDQEKIVGDIVKKQLIEPIEGLIMLQEKANLAKVDLVDKDFKFMTENGASNETKDLVKKIREVWGKKAEKGEKEEKGEINNFFKTMKDDSWKVPFTFGTEDIPYNEYRFAGAGEEQINRRWGDMGLIANGSKGLDEIISTGMRSYTNQEQILEALNKVYQPMQKNHPEDAKKVIMNLAEGVIKFYGKNYISRLPFGIGTLIGAISRKRSYAQVVYGSGAMAWDELQSNEFTRLVRMKFELTEDQQHELQKNAGGGKMEVLMAAVRTIIPLLGLAMAYYMFTQVTEEKK